jgi:hypothetical protein
MKPIELQMFWLKKVTDFAEQHNRYVPSFGCQYGCCKLSNLYVTSYDKGIIPVKTKVKPVVDKLMKRFGTDLLNDNLQTCAPKKLSMIHSFALELWINYYKFRQ